MGNNESSPKSKDVNTNQESATLLNESSQPNTTELEDMLMEEHNVFRVKEDLPQPIESPQTEIIEEEKNKNISLTDKFWNGVGKAIDSTVRISLKGLAALPIFKKETKELIGELFNLLEQYCSDVTVTELFVGYTILTSYYTHQHPHTYKYITEEEVLEGQYYMKFANIIYGWKLMEAMVFKKISKVGKGAINKITPGQHNEIEHNVECYVKYLGLPADTLFHAEWFSHNLRPAHLICISHEKKKIIVSIRGTMDFHDCMADVVCNYQPMETGGLAHRGIFFCAKNKIKEIEKHIEEALQKYPDYGIVFTGHSLGAATAGLMGHFFKIAHPDVSVKMHLYGCPPILDKDNSAKYINDAVVYVNGDDIIPRLTFGSLYDLKGMIKGVLDDNPTAGEKFWQFISAGKGLPKSWLESGNERWAPSGINLEKIKQAKRNEKIFPPGRVVYLFNPKSEHSRNWYAEETIPFHFDEIILSMNMYTDHLPTAYSRSLKRTLQRMAQMKEKNEHPPHHNQIDSKENEQRLIGLEETTTQNPNISEVKFPDTDSTLENH